MRRTLPLVLLATIPSTLWATTVALPRDLAALAQQVDAVLLAQAVKLEPGESFTTLVRFSPVVRLKGPSATDPLVVQLPGGVVGEVGMAVAGFPHFELGRVYLLFLRPLPNGRWQPATAALGVFVLTDQGTLAPVPEGLEVAAVRGEKSNFLRAYRVDLLLAELTKAIAGLPYSLEAAVAPDQPLPSPPANCVRMTHSDSLPIRWFGFETGFALALAATTPGQVGLADGGAGAVSAGTAAWSNYSAARLNISYGGVQPRTLDCSQGNRGGEVWFNDPCNQIADLVGCAGTLAFGGSYYSLSTQSYDGQTWHPGYLSGTSGPFVVVNNGAACIGSTNFAEMMTHEIGHTLFFGHHTDPSAVMYYMCCRGGGAQIYATDKVCASDQYHTFLDVPYSNWAWSYIEGVEDAGVTTGCGGGNYCPSATVTRAQMAVFLLRAKFGAAYNPPPCTGVFSDVPCPGHWAANWIEALAATGITTGCGSGKYCPEASVTRAQMAVFLLRAKEGSSYLPPPCAGVFADVPCPAHWAANWIEELAARGVTTGCGGANYCPASPVTRGQMAVFLVRNFNLPHP